MSSAWEQYIRDMNTRRQFLRRAGVATVVVGAGPTLIAACGGDDGATKTAASSGPSKAPTASGRLDFISWEGYDLPDVMKAWEADHNVTLKATYIANQDEVQTKLKASGGSGGYDITTYFQGYRPLYSELGILEPIDEQKVPNLKRLFPYFATDEGGFWKEQDGTRIAVPWTWGSVGITYDTRRVKSAPPSWYDLLDAKYKGRVAMIDDPVGCLMLTAHLLGLDPAKIKKDDLSKVTDLLNKVAAQSTGVSPTYGDMTTKLTSGDADLCWQGWAAINSFAADAGVDTVKTEMPKEGSYSFCDAWGLPKGSDNADTSLAWMNETLDPLVNARAAEALVGGVTVDGAVEHLNKATAALYPYQDLDGLLERAPLYNNPPVESDEFVTLEEWLKTWQEIKAQAGS
jgi:spermidine/putrescine transport system substrate-binding protein